MVIRRVFLKSESGIGLVGVLTAAAIVAVLLVVSATAIVNHMKSARAEQISDARFAVARVLQSAVNDERAIWNSANDPLNNPSTSQSLKDCMTNGTPAACNSSGKIYFYLRDGFGSTQIKLVAGEVNPSPLDYGGVLYDVFGKPCSTPNSATCILHARAFYEVKCTKGCVATFSGEVSSVDHSNEKFGNIFLNANNSSHFSFASVKSLPLGTSTSDVIPVWDSGNRLVASPLTQDSAAGIIVGDPTFHPPFLVHGLYNAGDSVSTTQTMAVSSPAAFGSTLNIGSSCETSQPPNGATASGQTCLEMAGSLYVVSPAVSMVNHGVYYPNIRVAGNTYVQGDTIATQTVDAGTFTSQYFYYTSDRRLKENITPIAQPDLMVRQLRPVSFNWKSTNERDLGFIAQEVEDIAPELVVTGADGKKGIKYGNLVALIVEGLKLENERAWKKLKNESDDLDKLERRQSALEEKSRKKSAEMNHE